METYMMGRRGCDAAGEFLMDLYSILELRAPRHIEYRSIANGISAFQRNAKSAVIICLHREISDGFLQQCFINMFTLAISIGSGNGEMACL
jgi:hypothetical protein